MNHRRMNKRAAVTAAAAATGLAVAAVLLPTANAGTEGTPEVREFGLQQAAGTGQRLTTELGENAAGWFYEPRSRQLVVNVVDDRSEAAVRAAGAVPRKVGHTMADLRAATDTLNRRAAVPGTAWSIDPKSNTVRVVADSTVDGAGWNRLTGVADGLAGRATVERHAGRFSPFVSDGGDPIFGGGSRCSLGFNVSVGGARAFLTAGHCGPVGSRWSEDGQGTRPLGTMTVSQFPGADFALVPYDNPNASAPSTVDLGGGQTRPITGAVEASVGLPVQRSGSTTGVSAGVVTGLNATVNYGNGEIVTGLIQTNVCAEPGDSGGPLFSGTAAVGLTSGGSGDCTRGGVTFFQPVTDALAATGARVGD
ncbi:S1 family peptidase [Streptomyces durbertensis]|uniref:S1 family peptidase n=1 Tax=Streptomyces durbertensis TaxID=2448886 RepID=A0ABR6EDL7_9ACTN|nr:S1 family peptidase [Streptomyces durbertensis]MBB1243045.1 S1 family peptidase [Streptomyces durbertensis]